MSSEDECTQWLPCAVNSIVKWWSATDPRSSEFLLIKYPLVLTVILATYHYGVNMGVEYMRTRKPFDLKRILVLHNGLMTLSKCYNFIQILSRIPPMSTKNFLCQLPQYRYPNDEEMAYWMYVHMWCQILGFLDTAFIVLRRKENLLSFYHRFHHFSVVVYFFIILKWVPAGSTTLLFLWNALLGTGTYCVLFLESIGWLRKDRTKMKGFGGLLEFVFGIAVGCHALFSGCPYPTWIVVVFILYMISFFTIVAVNLVKSKERKKKLR